MVRGPDVMAASTLDRDHILSSDGDHVGKILEIMLGVSSARIACAALERRLPRNRRQAALDSVERFDPGYRQQMLWDFSEHGQMKNALWFGQNAWPLMADCSWAESIHRYRDRRPYWQRFKRDDAIDRIVPPAL